MQEKNIFFEDDLYIDTATNNLFVIGIDTYQKGIPSLKNCVRDAQKFVRILNDKYQFDLKNTNVLYNKDATSDNIIEQLNYYTTNLTENDNLIIYFAGHGYYANKIGYLVPFDAEKNKVGRLLNNADIKSYIKSCKAKHIVLIVDSCYSGSFLLEKRSGYNQLEGAAKELFKHRSRWLLAAGSIEKVSDGAYGEHSPFAKTLLTYIEKPTNTPFSISHLAQFIEDRIHHNTNNQTPISGVLYDTDDFGGKYMFIPKNMNTSIISDVTASKVIDTNAASLPRIPRKWIMGISIFAFLLLIVGTWTIRNVLLPVSLETSGKIQGQIVEPGNLYDPFEKLMVIIPKGTFQMGNDAYKGSYPKHTVHIDSFAMCKYEVSQRQWEIFTKDYPSRHKDCLDCPVDNVYLPKIAKFIAVVNAVTGKEYRLPTEAEWEYAAKSGQNFTYSGGNNINDVAWSGLNSDSITHPCGQKKPNAYGLYDMTGNVWELCADTWHETYEGAPNDGSAWIDTNAYGTQKAAIFRGGSWYNGEFECRIKYRYGNQLNYFAPSHGLRLALSLK